MARIFDELKYEVGQLYRDLQRADPATMRSDYLLHQLLRTNRVITKVLDEDWYEEDPGPQIGEEYL